MTLPTDSALPVASPMQSFQGGVRVPRYTAPKSAVAGLARPMAEELDRHGITADAIVRAIWPLTMPPACARISRKRVILEFNPLGRWCEQRSLADMAVLPVSPASAHCTDTVHPVDGGWPARWVESMDSPRQKSQPKNDRHPGVHHQGNSCAS